MRHLALVLLLAAACGDKKESDKPAPAPAPAEGKPGAAPAPAPALRPLGLPSVAAHAYQWGKADPAFKKLVAAHKLKDWPTARLAGEETLAVDANHLGAHRLLAAVLAAESSFERAAEHLETAIAGDWLAFAAGAETDPELAALWAAPAGAGLKAKLPGYRDAFQQAARGGLLVVARRGKLKLAEGAGAQRVSHRAELYAYDLAGKRWLRLTHTDDKL